MAELKTTILFRANHELEQIFERMRRNCEQALEIIRDIKRDDLSPQSRQRLCDRVHTLREIVKILTPDFEKELTAETEKRPVAYPPMRPVVCCMVWMSFSTVQS